MRRGGIEGAVKIDHPYYLTGATAAAFFDLAGSSIVAERLTDYGHRGYVLAPGAPTQPDWAALEAHAVECLDEIRTQSEGDPL